MYKNKKVVVVLPAYNAEKTLEKTYSEIIEQDYVDLLILVDDASKDKTAEIASKLDKVKLIVHKDNRGYRGNQKTCSNTVLDAFGQAFVSSFPKLA